MYYKIVWHVHQERLVFAYRIIAILILNIFIRYFLTEI